MNNNCNNLCLHPPLPPPSMPRLRGGSCPICRMLFLYPSEALAPISGLLFSIKSSDLGIFKKDSAVKSKETGNGVLTTI